MHQFLVGRDVDTVDLVVSDVAMDPLNLWTQLIQDVARPLGHRFQFQRRHLARARYDSLNDILWHYFSPFMLMISAPLQSNAYFTAIPVTSAETLCRRAAIRRHYQSSPSDRQCGIRTGGRAGE